MEVMYKTKGVIIFYPLPVFAIMLIILLNGYCCGAAAVLVETNTTFRCDGRLDECLIQDDLELEFLINPYVSRLLQSGGQEYVTESVNNPTSTIKPCGSTPTYSSCNNAPGKKDNRQCTAYDNLNRCLRH